MTEEYVPQWANKIDVATLQIRTAIRLHFEGYEPVTLHTVVASAHGVISDLAKRNGPSELDKAARIATEFFRSAAQDPNGRLNIEPLPQLTQDLLFDAVTTLQVIAGDIPFEAKLYWAWFMCRHPGEFENAGPAVADIMKDNRHLGTMSFRDIRQLLRFQQVLNQAEPLPEWALLGPGPVTSMLTADERQTETNGPPVPNTQPEPRDLEYDSVVGRRVAL